MRIFFGILIGFAVAAGIAIGAAYMAFGDIRNVGERDRSKDISQAYDLAGFDEIDVAGVYEVNVKVGGDFSVNVSGAPEEMERAEVSVENGVLVLSQADRPRSVRSWRNQGMTADISLPSLSVIDVAGVGDAEISGVQADSFTARLAGVGEINVSGTCGDLTARVSGVGDLDASGLECARVDVAVSGVGEATVYASESVDASVGGIGSITVHGSPSQVEKSGGFLSDITIK